MIQQCEVFYSIIANLTEMFNSKKKKNQKTLKQKRKKPNWWPKLKDFLEKMCNMESKV